MDGQYAYLAKETGWFVALDLADGISPVLVDSVALGQCGWMAYIQGGYAYVSTSTHFVIVDVHDPADLSVVGQMPFGRQFDIRIVDHYAVCAGDGGTLAVIDVADPANPRLALAYDTPGTPYGLWTAGNIIYVADNGSFVVLQLDEETAAGEPVATAREFGLLANYPNPFNATTTLSYTLPTAGPAELVIFDALGRRVAVLFDGVQPAGPQARRWDASGLPTGVYLARLQSGEAVATQKLLLLK